jgi:hypothetical protein
LPLPELPCSNSFSVLLAGDDEECFPDRASFSPPVFFFRFVTVLTSKPIYAHHMEISQVRLMVLFYTSLLHRCHTHL